MMRNMMIMICFVVVVQIGGMSFAGPATDISVQNEIEIHFVNLSSSDFEKRKQAIFYFADLKKEAMSKQIMDALIDLFENEVVRIKEFNELVRKTGSIEEKVPGDMLYLNSEDFMEYHAQLCKLVGETGDKSLLPLLIDYCLTPEIVRPYGDSAADLLLEFLKTEKRLTRKNTIILVLGEMLQKKDDEYVATGRIRTAIKNSLIQSTMDSDYNIKIAAVRALGKSGDEDVIPLLEKIAKSDPKHFEKKDRTTGKMTTRYPVREEAEKALSKFKQTEVKK